MPSFMKIACVAVAFAVCAEAVGKPALVPEPHYEAPGPVRVEVAPLPYCPDGTEYTVGGCATYETAEPKADCPHPYKMTKEGNCVTKTKGESALVCPKGTHLEGHHCVTEVVVEPEAVCKKGVLVKDSCLVRGEAKTHAPKHAKVYYDCPKGFKRDGDSCYNVEKVDADIVCEKGYELNGHKCVAIETAELYCKHGQFSKGQCVESKLAAPKPTCPKHTKLDGKGTCVTQIKQKPTMVCEKGYTLSKHGKKCETKVLVQALATKKGEVIPIDCHGETDDQGNCYQTHTTDSAPVCEKGFVLDGKYCKTVISTPAEYLCPHGYETASTGKSADCVQTKVSKAVCPKGFKLEKGVCANVISSKPAKVCPKGTNADGKHCKTVEIIPATPYCKHDDYELTKEGCVKPGYAVPDEDKAYPIHYECPKGYKLDKKAMECFDVQKSKAETVCEKGYQKEGKKCVAYHEVPPQVMCPKGFVGDNKACSRVTYDAPHFTCPKGSEDHGKKCYTVQEQQQKKFGNIGKARKF